MTSSSSLMNMASSAHRTRTPSPTRNGSFLTVTPTHRLTLGGGYRTKYPRPSTTNLFHDQYDLYARRGRMTHEATVNTIMRFRAVWRAGREPTSSWPPSPSGWMSSLIGAASFPSSSTLKLRGSFAHACGVDHSKLWVPAVILVNLGREG